MYLLDTNVISELRKKKPHGAVSSWFEAAPAAEIHLPAVVIGELQAGVEKTRRQDALKAAEIERWIDRIVRTLGVLSMDGTIFREWARMTYGKSDELSSDAMIAATARIHGLIIVTRNVKDFASFSVQVFNPFSGK
jgi:predicted nucleic acid-binding protein